MLITYLIHEAQIYWDTHLRKSMMFMTPLTVIFYTVVLIIMSAIEPSDSFPEWLVGTLTAFISILLSIIAFFVIKFVYLIQNKIKEDNAVMKALSEKLDTQGDDIIELKTEVKNIKENMRKRVG